MTFSITINESFSAWAKEFPELINRQLSYAARLTVNDLAFAIKEDLDKEHLKFHNPTPFTTKAIRVFKDSGALREIVSNVNVNQGQPTRVGRTEFSAYVGLIQQGMPERFSGVAKRVPGVTAAHDDSWERVFSHHYGGGMRRYKPFEGALMKRGFMPSGHYAVPGVGCPMDEYDNPQRGFMVQLLSYFDTFGENGYRANMKAKGRARFEKKLSGNMGGALQTGFFISYGDRKGAKGDIKNVRNYKKLHPGIWQRFYGGIWGNTLVRPVFLFVRATAYRQRIDVVSIGRDVMTSKAAPLFGKNLDKAIQGDRSIQHLFKK